MQLIIDNGGTKAIWVLTENQQIREQFTTKGIYPPLSKDTALIDYFQEGNRKHQYPIDQVFFYSTGCRPAYQKARLIHILQNSFAQTSTIEVQTDVLAAARALCGHQPGIACIMGTGSNSCLYDGQNIISNKGGYGFILGDEGSGAVLGKSLLQAFLYQALPPRIETALRDRFQLNVEDVLLNVYQNDAPNKYIASFAPFIHEHRKDPFIAQLIFQQFDSFFEKCVVVYPSYQQLALHFLGSIAFHFKEELNQCARKYGIAIRSFTQDPMPGLVKFHG